MHYSWAVEALWHNFLVVVEGEGTSFPPPSLYEILYTPQFRGRYVTILHQQSTCHHGRVLCSHPGPYPWHSTALLYGGRVPEPGEWPRVPANDCTRAGSISSSAAATETGTGGPRQGLLNWNGGTVWGQWPGGDHRRVQGGQHREQSKGEERNFVCPW